MTASPDTTGLWAGRFAIVLLAVLSLACIIPGAMLYSWIVTDILDLESSFLELHFISWFAGLLAAALVGFGLLIAGIALRISSSPQAPLMSLMLAVGSLAFAIATYLIFSDTAGYQEPLDILRIGCLVFLLVVVAPPFLHWSTARPVAPSGQPPEIRQ